MYFAVICRDKPDALQLRLDTRPTHLEHLNRVNESGALKVAGPLLGDDGKPMGSLLIVEADDAEAARKLAEADPYAKAGLFESVEIRAWNWVFNAPSEA
ncbi:YciI-like protein [Pararhizobium haloflavum]|uniref:YciI-like protein n=1 Tax=Pararhizobium haloflavum TaxID=2037914 RepID=UPI000C17B58F|nr:YciI-like protein [Pararhizobium haloflavum]